MEKRIFKDQLNREIGINFPPKRIISLVPSQTELLFDLGLDAEIIGITKFCIHPAQHFKQKTKIGGTKEFNFSLIKELKPDLIIGNKEENQKEQIELLMQDYPVWMSDIYNLDDALAMINDIGSLVNKTEEAHSLTKNISKQFSTSTFNDVLLSAAYFIWKNPFMLAGKNTFIDTMLPYCGLKNITQSERYPQINVEEIIKLNPQVILLSSEPYPFKEKHIEEFKKILPDAIIQLVDGEMFSWYGSRLLKAPAYFKKLSEHFF